MISRIPGSLRSESTCVHKILFKTSIKTDILSAFVNTDPNPTSWRRLPWEKSANDGIHVLRLSSQL